jgi:hypothetical protein
MKGYCHVACADVLVVGGHREGKIHAPSRRRREPEGVGVVDVHRPKAVAVKGTEDFFTKILRESIGVAVIPGNEKGALDGYGLGPAAELRYPAKRECAGGRIDLKGLQGRALPCPVQLDVCLGASAVDRPTMGSAAIRRARVERRVDLRHLRPDSARGLNSVRMKVGSAHRDEVTSGGADHQAYGVLEWRARHQGQLAGCDFPGI